MAELNLLRFFDSKHAVVGECVPSSVRRRIPEALALALSAPFQLSAFRPAFIGHPVDIIFSIHVSLNYSSLM
jgi:hypothetical protein